MSDLSTSQRETLRDSDFAYIDRRASDTCRSTIRITSGTRSRGSARPTSRARPPGTRRPNGSSPPPSATTSRSTTLRRDAGRPQLTRLAWRAASLEGDRPAAARVTRVRI